MGAPFQRPVFMTMVSLSPSELAGMSRLLRKAGGEIILTVDGCSMMPLFAGPARLRVVCGDVPEYTPGMVVLFKGERATLVVHRIVAVSRSKKYLITCGDNNGAIDRPVSVGWVLGVVSGFADPDAASEWDRQPPRRQGPLWRAGIAIARMHFGLAWVLASVSIFVQAAQRRMPRLSTARGR
jgi:hypothetical protein